RACWTCGRPPCWWAAIITKYQVCQPVSRPIRRCPTPRYRKRSRRCGRRWGPGGGTGRPRPMESGGDSRIPAAIGYPLGAQEGDTTFVPVPLSHNTGFTTATIALLMRHHLVLMSRFEPEKFLRLISDHRVTFLTTVPTI